MSDCFDGWLLEVYEDKLFGATLWFLDKNGERRSVHQRFPVTFYAAGSDQKLAALGKYLKHNCEDTTLRREDRPELCSAEPTPVLSVQTPTAFRQQLVFRRASKRFPELDFFDADIPLALRHSAAYGTFPLAHCQVYTNDRSEILEINICDTPWDIDPILPALKILFVQPEIANGHALSGNLIIRHDTASYRIPVRPGKPLLLRFAAILQDYDPDLLLSDGGDTWLLDWLIARASRAGLSLPLNRDPHRKIIRKKAKSYFSYGQIVYRGQQVLLSGRWHIDVRNATLWDDYGLPGTLEFARVTHLPLQTAARSSPGTGISSMQILTALRNGIMVPWHKQQTEIPKSALEMIHDDKGGLVYQPVVGLHQNVGEIDFISMYPSLMVRDNISPETIQAHASGQPDQLPPGLIPQTLAPLLNKRVALKKRLASAPTTHARHHPDKPRSSAHKWLLVTCFGYLGYKNARFGRIEAHEAVTAGSREALLLAKEAAEQLGFTVLHMYVDALWVQKNDRITVKDYEQLLYLITRYTGLDIALDGIYRWVVFLPSRNDEKIPVANRYFGVFQDGSIKVRGIEARRHDTAPFIARTQLEILEHLALAPSASAIPEQVPGIHSILRKRLAELRSARIPMDQLLVSLKLSRELSNGNYNSPAARAARQLEQIGKNLRPGQRVRFLYLRCAPGVHAWDLPYPPEQHTIDIDRYTTLLLRAASTVLHPLGIREEHLPSWLLERTSTTAPLLFPVAATPFYAVSSFPQIP